MQPWPPGSRLSGLDLDLVLVFSSPQASLRAERDDFALSRGSNCSVWDGSIVESWIGGELQENNGDSQGESR